MLQAGTPRDLYERPASAQVARFVGHSTLLPGRVLAHGAVDVRFATLHADTGAHRPGAEIAVLVRPEHVQADPPTHTVNRLDGRPGHVRYLGATQRYDFHPHGASDPLLCEGREPAARSIAIDPRHLLVLPVLPASPDAP
ncbi:hypothetical protein BVI1335_2890003 [Burkholderia vietnamiensis]|nr:hypothetical protein BVI1335_2890003 [Burkholderia vietnamiensis]